MAHRNDKQIVRQSPPPSPTQPIDFDSESTNGEQGLVEVFHERLSGRWMPAILLGVILACLFGYLGYRSTSVKYESTGIVHVSPKTNIVMREIPETGMIPRYPSFIQTQATLISSSPRVLERALQSIELQEVPWNDRISGMRIIRQGINARVTRDSELIHVSFIHQSPAVAQAVVNAVIRAYAEFHVSSDGDDINQTLQKLRAVRQSLQNQRMQRQAQIQELISSSDYAFSEMGEVISQKAMRLQALEAEARQLEHLMAMADSHRQTQPEGAPQRQIDLGDDPVTGGKIDHRDLEAFDADLARLGRAREDARNTMERVRERFTSRHRAYYTAEQELRIAERLYQERLQIAAQAFVESDRLSLVNWAMEPRQRLAQVQREAEQERSLLSSMQRMQMRLNDLRSEVEEIQHEERETAARIRSLSIEADSIRRISVASLGELPSEPSQDRRAAFAAIGAFGGFSASIGFFFLLASLDQRVFGVAQLGSASNRQLLGVLPALPRDQADLESSSVAAHCIHQIRNRIESLRKPGRSTVLATSSPYQGDGKTSLTLALAASYAASGYRTLLVDCDFIGRSLTHNLMMTGQSGLQECLMFGDSPEQHIRSLPVENLHVLPVGVEPSMGPERVRRSDIESLFQRLRTVFDVVLVDTGPLIGSVESIPVVSAADGVVLTMWRGRRQARLNECVKAMHNAGVQYLGVVLNYARQSDCNRYLSCSKTSAMGAVAGNGSRNGKTKSDVNVSRNALLRAMQLTARTRPRRHSGTSNLSD